jgi:hypothetical protein
VGKKIKKGDSGFSATEFNRHVDASEFVLRNLMFSNGTPKRGIPGDTNFVSVKNGSGADRRQGEILEFTGLELTDLTSRDLILTGGSPTLANGFGVLQSPIKSAEYQPDCQIAGGCVALVNVLDADDRYARPIASTYVLQSVAIGPVRILWKPPETGEKTCAVLLGSGGSSKTICVTNADITHHSTGDVERLKRDSGAWVRSGETFDAIDIFTNTGETIPACYVVGVIDYEGLKVIDSIYCKASDWLGC